MAKTPKIRFKNFSDEWENNNLGEICKIIKGEQINKLSLLENGKYYVLNGGISPSGYINTYNTLENTISISEGGNSCGYVKFNIEKFWSGGHNYTLNELKTKTLFLYSFLKAKQQKIMALRVGSGLPNIQKNTLSNISISIPNSEEQEKIGAFFSKLDKLIALHQSKFEKLQKIKKSCLQNLFPQNNQNTPKIRFKNFTDEWVENKLKEIAQKVTEKNLENKINETFTNSAEFGIISQRDFFNHDISNVENLSNYYIVQNDDFIYNPRISTTAPVGPINRNKLCRSGVMSPLYTIFRTHNIDKLYLEYFFKTKIWHSYMKLNGDSGVRSDRLSIKDSIFFEMGVKTPNSEEQEKIGAFFSKLDKLIALHQSKFEKLQKIKKSCLQNMFV